MRDLIFTDYLLISAIIVFGYLMINLVSAETPDIYIDTATHNLNQSPYNISAGWVDAKINYSNVQNSPDFILNSSEGNLNVNSSLSLNTSIGYMRDVNDTWFDIVTNILTMDLTQLTLYINSWLSGKTTDDLTEGSTNLYDNRSFNQSHTDTLYADISVVDTNASSICSTDEVLLGNGSCMSSSSFGGGSNYYPATVNLTTNTYTGNLTYDGNSDGYATANAICDAEFSGSHMCDESEISQWFAVNGGMSVSGDAWCNAGGPKYVPATIPVNDCHGWTYNGTTSYLGNYWHFDSTTGGDGRAINCGTELSLCCASYN